MNVWGVRAFKTGGLEEKDYDVGVTGSRLRWAPKCSFCGRGAPLETPHTHLKCPFVMTQNRIRAKEDMVPLEVVDGVIERKDVKVDIE